MQSILVIRLSSLGDVVLSTPIVRQLQVTYPDSILDVAVAAPFAGVYEHNPRIRRLWSLENTEASDTHADELKLSIKESLPRSGYDLIVDLQHNFRSSLFRRGLGDNVVLAPKHRLEKLALVYFKRKPVAITHVVERYRSAIANLPLMLDTDGPEVWLPNERANGTYKPPNTKFASNDNVMRVALAPGARHATKRWPVSKAAALCKMLVDEGAHVTLVGGLADVSICNAVEDAAGVSVDRADGASTVEQTVRALDDSDVLVTNDSGVMHLGAARRIPVVAIFGSTVKELGFTPFGTRFTVVEHDVQCRPCSHIGRATCPKGHFLCMESIAPATVLLATKRLVQMG